MTRESNDPDGDVLRARRLYVLPMHRGHGAGPALAGAIIQEAFQTAPILNVHSTRAGAFWEKMGFSPIENEPGITHRLAR